MVIIFTNYVKDGRSLGATKKTFVFLPVLHGSESCGVKWNSGKIICAFELLCPGAVDG